VRNEIGDYSPLTQLAMRAFHVARKVSPMFWLSKRCPLLKSRNELSTQELFSQSHVRRRAKAVELYIIAWLFLEACLVGVVCFCQLPLPFIVGLVLAAVAGLRIIEIFQVTVNAAFFDSFSGRSDNMVASSPRIIVLAFYNFIELAVCFGVLYALNPGLLKGAGRPVTSFYFSLITQLTIGYGDVYPTSYLRAIAAVQGIVSVVFVVLVFGRFVSTLPRMKGLLEEDQTGGTALNEPEQSRNALPQEIAPPSKVNTRAKPKSNSQEKKSNRVRRRNNSKQQRQHGLTPR
jgi:hypothetical protein